MDKLTERLYNVRLYRAWSGSAFNIEVKAASSAAAQRIAENQNPGWKAENAQ